MVFEIGDQVAPALIDDSQPVTEPVLPDKVRVPVAGEQRVALVLTVPPTEAGVTVTVKVESIAAQGALVTVKV